MALLGRDNMAMADPALERRRMLGQLLLAQGTQGASSMPEGIAKAIGSIAGGLMDWHANSDDQKQRKQFSELLSQVGKSPEAPAPQFQGGSITEPPRAMGLAELGQFGMPKEKTGMVADASGQMVPGPGGFEPPPPPQRPKSLIDLLSSAGDNPYAQQMLQGVQMRQVERQFTDPQNPMHLGHGVLYDPASGKTQQVPGVVEAELAAAALKRGDPGSGRLQDLGGGYFYNEQTGERKYMPEVAAARMSERGASGTNVNVNASPYIDAGAKKGNEEAYKLYAGRIEEARKTDDASVANLGRIKTINGLLQGIDTGPFTEWRASAEGVLNQLGVPVDKQKLGNVQTAKAEIARMQLDAVNQLKGAVSDAEGRWIRETGISLTTSPEGRATMEGIAARVAERNEKIRLAENMVGDRVLRGEVSPGEADTYLRGLRKRVLEQTDYFRGSK